jgi:RNA polymerase sigma factor (sigma-70 family)
MTPLLSISLLRTQSDDRLVRLAAAGHERAFEAIVERYRRPLARYVRRLVPDGRAEDVVQATFVSAWASLHDGAQVRDLRPWLYRIAHNASLNLLKRAGEHHDELADTLRGTASVEAEIERRDAVRRTLGGIAALPDRQRAALLAVAVDGRPHADVAAELGLSDGGLRQLVHRARTALRAAATVLTPPPLAAAAAASQGLGADRVAEIGAGAGGAGAAAATLKASAVVLTAGALVAGAPPVRDALTGGDEPRAAKPAPARHRHAAAGQAGVVPGRDVAAREIHRGHSGSQARAHDAGDDHGGSSGRGRGGADDGGGRHDGRDDAGTRHRGSDDGGLRASGSGHEGAESTPAPSASATGTGSDSGSGSGSGSGDVTTTSAGSLSGSGSSSPGGDGGGSGGDDSHTASGDD